MFEQLQIHRQILYDLTVHYLERMEGGFERLAFVASLRNPVSGAYAHQQLGAAYGEERVNEVLGHCHEELFERLLESPLALQEQDLLHYLATQPEQTDKNLEEWRQLSLTWIPTQAPDYLKELFASNLHALCELQQESTPRVHSNK